MPLQLFADLHDVGADGAADLAHLQRPRRDRNSGCARRRSPGRTSGRWSRTCATAPDPAPRSRRAGKIHTSCIGLAVQHPVEMPFALRRGSSPRRAGGTRCPDPTSRRTGRRAAVSRPAPVRGLSVESVQHRHGVMHRHACLLGFSGPACQSLTCSSVTSTILRQLQQVVGILGRDARRGGRRRRGRCASPPCRRYERQ